MSLSKINLLVNRTKPQAIDFALEALAWLTERDIEVRIDSESAFLLGRDDISVQKDMLAKADLIVTLGGDGTILDAMQFAGPAGTPVLGVHMGRFGFITECHPNDFISNIDLIVSGRFDIEPRLMLQAKIIRDGQIVGSSLALNDIVVNRGATARMLNLKSMYGDQEMTAYPADGIILATPTGSTAYALSAGGPLVEPTVEALIVVPICPHTLSARPMLLPAAETVNVFIESDGGEILCAADSIEVQPLNSGDRIEIKRSEFSAKIVRLGYSNFYKKVRERLLWGERLNF